MEYKNGFFPNKLRLKFFVTVEIFTDVWNMAQKDSHALSESPAPCSSSFELSPHMVDVYIGLATVSGYK